MEPNAIQAETTTTWEDALILSFAGTCRPSYGGTGTYGFVLSRRDRILADDRGLAACGPGASIYMAAYTGLILGLAALSRCTRSLPIEIHSDTGLVIAHMTASKGCYSKHLAPYHHLAARYAGQLDTGIAWRLVAQHENPAWQLAASVWQDGGQVFLDERTGGRTPPRPFAPDKPRRAGLGC